MNYIQLQEYNNILSLINIESFKNKSILVTGANGLIGSYLIDFLLYVNNAFNYKIKIYAMARSKRKLEKRFKPDKNLVLIEQDLNEPINKTIQVDYIVHAASNAHPCAFSADPVGTMKTNLLGTINLLEMIKGTNTKFLYISSGEIYGNNIDNAPFKEEDFGSIDTKNPRSCYPESKRAAETICVSYNAQFGLSVNILRLCYVYGPVITADNSRADAQFLRNAINGEDIILKSEGLQRRTYLYVADAISAILLVLSNGKNAEFYNVANLDSIASVREYASILAKTSNVGLKFETPDDIEKSGYSKPLDSILNSDKLINLGWRPFYGLKEGLSNTIKIKKEILFCLKK